MRRESHRLLIGRPTTTSPPSATSPGHGDRLLGLAAADRHPAVEQDAGACAHPGAGDAHYVHPAEIGQCRDPAGGRAAYQRRAGSLPVLRAVAGVVGRGPHEANLRRSATAVSTCRASMTSAAGAPAADAWAHIAAIRSGSVS